MSDMYCSMSSLTYLSSDFLDVHTTILAADDGYSGGLTVGNNADVELFLDVQPFFNQNLANQFSLGAGLFGDQGHTDDGVGDGLYVIFGFRQFNTAAFTTATGMYLGFDNNWITELFRDLCYLIRGKGKFSLGGRYVKFSE